MMRTIRKSIVLLLGLCMTMALSAAAPLQKTFDYSRIGNHPRLLLNEAGWTELKKKATASKQLKPVHQHVIAVGDKLMDKSPVEYKKTGRRLLSVSREALYRIFHLSYAYQATGQKKYLQRAEQELLAISGFSDWNPSHFLDVAEMTMAAAIGYDWCFHGLPDASKAKIREAILEKGLNASLKAKNNGTKSRNNWNQVCNAGMVYGGLAVYEDAPELARQMLERAQETIPLAMGTYAPDGIYPEGYGYWNYGTSFQVMLTAALESIFGHDGGMSDFPGFDKTAGFMLYMMGTSNRAFNFSDSGGGGMSCHPAVYWFAAKYGNLEWLYLEKKQLEKSIREDKFGQDRLFPALLIFAKDIDFDKIPVPTRKVWAGQGENPLVMVRTGWQDGPQDRYLGIKAGTAQASHSHLDAGSFVYDVGALRWAVDLGSVSYHSIEKLGMNLWGRGQDAQRWTIFRYHNRAHNTLTVNDKNHNVKGHCHLTQVYADGRELGGDLDMTEVLFDLKKAHRKIVLVDEKDLVVTDRVQAGDSAVVIRWNMVTPAKVKIEDDRTVRLTQKNQSLVMRFEGTEPLTVKTWSTEPTTSYDPPNPNTVIVGFETTLPAGREAAYTVTLSEK